MRGKTTYLRPCALLILLLLLAACGDPPSMTTGRIDGEDAVRVALRVAVSEVTLGNTGGFHWRDQNVQGEVGKGDARLREVNGQIELEYSGQTHALGPGPVHLYGSGEWRLGPDIFGGALIVQKATWGGITLVNLVAIEEYLRGVVPWEIGRPGDDALEAVKAQAIAARTYTLRHLGRWESLGFDLYADTRDQVYRGHTGTAPITDRAVRETSGQVIIFDGELARAYYSSTCGGHTSTLTDVWDREGAPYLTGRRDADVRGRSWCRESAQFRWVEEWSARELAQKMREHLGEELEREIGPQEFGVLESVEVLGRDASGRVQRLGIHTDRDSFTVWGDRIRWVLRPSHSRFAILRSTMFRIEEKRQDGALVAVVVRGAGFGHGVGLCQTGALGRARAGQSAREILDAYYPGATIRPGTTIRRRGSAQAGV